MRLPLIVLEGLDGTGKTTISSKLAEQLTARGVPAVALSTPPEDYKLLVRYVGGRCSVEAKYLFFLSGVLHASELIDSMLPTTAVVCDRYIYSTIAYHEALGSKLRIDTASLNIIEPDFKFWLTVTDDAERRRRVRSRDFLTAGDEVLLIDEALRHNIESVFRRFNLELIETGGRTIGEVVDALLEYVL